MRVSFRSGIQLAALLGSIGLAHASNITVESSFSLTTTNFTTQSLTFNKFDSSLGTLNSVTLTFLATGTLDTSAHTELVSNGYVQNKGGLATGVEVGVKAKMNTTADADFSTISFNFIANAFHYPADDGNLAAYGGTDFTCTTPFTGCSGAGSDTTYWQGLTSQLGLNTSGITSQTVAASARFIGASGSWTLNNIVGQGSITEDIPGSVNQNALTQVSGVADVTYSYTPFATPEPATLGLMGSALVGLAALSKKLRKQ